MADDPKNPNLIDEKDVPANWVPVSSGPSQGSAPPLPNEMPTFFSGSMAPQLQHDGTFVGTEVASPRVPKFSLMPLGNQSSGFTNAAAQSTAIRVVEASPSLNLIAGPGIQITQNGNTDTISATGTGDGLVHGDTIWEIDPAYMWLRDDFQGGSTTTGAVGEIGWATVTTNGGPSLVTRGASLPNSGIFQLTNSGTAATVSAIAGTTVFLGNSAASSPSPFMPLFDYPGWKAIFIFGLGFASNSNALNPPFLTQKSIYVGLSATPKPETTWGGAGRPLTFMGVRFDTDATAPAISDTTFHFEVVANPNAVASPNRNNTQGTTFDTGVTPTVGQFYRLEIECIQSGVITMSLNGSTPQTFNVPTITVGGAGESGIATANSGFVDVQPGSLAGASDGQIFVAGSKVAISNVAGAPFTALNGNTVTLLDSTGGPAWKFVFAIANTGVTTITNGKFVGFPGVTPLFSFSNDTHATPVAASTSLLIDYFSLVWNPGVGGGTGTPVSTKSRYF